MREILFRGKSEVLGWVYGWYFPEVKWGEHHFPVGITHKTKEGWLDDVVVIPETIGQYTGLTDKNGKKIFEGDIVAQNWYDHNEPADDSFGEVVFCEYDCSFSVIDVEKDGIVPLGKCHAYHWEAEVIGNIHDNPELLENP